MSERIDTPMDNLKERFEDAPWCPKCAGRIAVIDDLGTRIAGLQQVNERLTMESRKYADNYRDGIDRCKAISEAHWREQSEVIAKLRKALFSTHEQIAILKAEIQRLDGLRRGDDA